MWLENMVNAEGIDVLQRSMEFASRRHALIAHNIANLSTPGFQPIDVAPDSFRAAMQKAVRERREEHEGLRRHPIRPGDTADIAFHRDGLSLRPRAAEHNLMFHDQNDRDLERIMQDLAENTMVYRNTTELLRNRFGLLTSAIRAKP